MPTRHESHTHTLNLARSEIKDVGMHLDVSREPIVDQRQGQYACELTILSTRTYIRERVKVSERKRERERESESEERE